MQHTPLRQLHITHKCQLVANWQLPQSSPGALNHFLLLVLNHPFVCCWGFKHILVASILLVNQDTTRFQSLLSFPSGQKYKQDILLMYCYRCIFYIFSYQKPSSLYSCYATTLLYVILYVTMLFLKVAAFAFESENVISWCSFGGQQHYNSTSAVLEHFKYSS